MHCLTKCGELTWEWYELEWVLELICVLPASGSCSRD